MIISCSPPEAAIRADIGSGETLSPAKVYPDEKIEITLWKIKGDPSDQISIELEPNHALNVKKYALESTEERIKINAQILDTKLLNENLFRELRARLSVYRPEELSADGPFILPRGCNMVAIHGQSIIAIAFRDPQHRQGAFLLPNECVKSSAVRTKSDLREILSKLPALKGVSGYGWNE